MSSLSTEQAIRTRRAVKSFDASHQMSAAEEQKLFDLAQQAPSSFNIQHWRFVKVTDPDQRAKLRVAAWNQAQVTDASLMLVICADLKAWEKNPTRYWENAPEEVRTYLSNAILEFYRGREWLARDEAMRSVGLVAQTLMLAAKDMGYDSCPMIGCDIDAVAELINLPDDHAIGMLLAIGKGITPARDKGGYLPLDEIVIENTFK
jgi:nitroreductase